MPSKIIRNRSLYYQDVGQGYPILFGHSYLWDRKMWQPQIDFLYQNYRCIVPDLWSHGFSEEVPQRPYSIELLSKDYFHLMNSLGLSKFIIVGHSIGGMWGTQLAVNHPQSVTGLILLDTYVGEEPEEKQSIYYEMLDSIERNHKFSDELIDQVAAYLLSPNTFTQKPELVQVCKRLLQSIPHERLAGLIELGYTQFSRCSLMAMLPQLTMPTLVMCGEHDLPRPKEESSAMVAKLPNARLSLIKQAGHITNLEQPELVNALIAEFLLEILTVEKTPDLNDAYC